MRTCLQDRGQDRDQGHRGTDLDRMWPQIEVGAKTLALRPSRINNSRDASGLEKSTSEEH